MGVRNVRGSARTVHAYVAETEPTTGTAEIGVVFIDTRGRVLRTMRQAPPQAATWDLAVSGASSSRSGRRGAWARAP